MTTFFLLFFLQDMVAPPFKLFGWEVAQSAEAAMTVFFVIQSVCGKPYARSSLRP